MKTKQQLQTELDDTIAMLQDAVKLRNWTIAGHAAGHCEALCARLRKESLYLQLSDNNLEYVKDSMAKLGALLRRIEAMAEAPA